MSDDIPFEVVVGNMFELKGNALIFSTKGENKGKRSVIASRICSNFPIDAIVTRAALEMWFSNPRPTIQNLTYQNDMTLLGNLMGHEDLIYAGDTFDASLSRECVDKASDEYISCIETQLVHKIQSSKFQGFKDLPNDIFLPIVFFNYVLPISDAFKSNDLKRAKRVKREFSEITKGYHHPSHINEIYNALKNKCDELATNVVYQMATIKNENFEMTGLLKREHDVMKNKRHKR
jgi:hypothetical protein